MTVNLDWNKIFGIFFYMSQYSNYQFDELLGVYRYCIKKQFYIWKIITKRPDLDSSNPLLVLAGYFSKIDEKLICHLFILTCLLKSCWESKLVWKQKHKLNVNFNKIYFILIKIFLEKLAFNIFTWLIKTKQH